jgi:hypothetical protein
MYIGLFEKNKIYVRYRRQDLPLGPSDMFFQDQVLLRYRPIWGGWGLYFEDECVVVKGVRMN